ncbi:MAG: ferrous iron transport protein A [Alphaproteobacteria bacterium]|nr:ferrous iron transport protein A [Alphaproteobacteria bacterium]
MKETEDLCKKQKAYSLTLASVGEDVFVVSFSFGRNLQRKLKDIGLMVGIQVKVLENDFSGPLLLAIGDTRVALGRGMAHKIMVQTKL